MWINARAVFALSLLAATARAGIVYENKSILVRGVSGATITSFTLTIDGAAVGDIPTTTASFTVPDASLPANGKARVDLCVTSADMANPVCSAISNYASSVDYTFVLVGSRSNPLRAAALPRSTSRDGAMKAEGKNLLYIENTRVMNDQSTDGETIMVRRVGGTAEVIAASIPFLTARQIEVVNMPSPLKIEAVATTNNSLVVGSATIISSPSGTLVDVEFGGTQAGPVITTNSRSLPDNLPSASPTAASSPTGSGDNNGDGGGASSGNNSEAGGGDVIAQIGPAVGGTLAVIIALVLWWFTRGRYWWYTTSHKRLCFHEHAICNGCCCFHPYEARKPPFPFGGGEGRKHKSVRVAPCYPHNICATCRGGLPEDNDVERHPCGLGCACDCAWLGFTCKWPAFCLQRLCEDEVEGERAAELKEKAKQKGKGFLAKFGIGGKKKDGRQELKDEPASNV